MKLTTLRTYVRKKQKTCFWFSKSLRDIFKVVFLSKNVTHINFHHTLIDFFKQKYQKLHNFISQNLHNVPYTQFSL